MKRTPPKSAKILSHGDGAGVPSLRDVDERAQENAAIENRRHVDREDLRQARDELRGNNLPPDSDTDETISLAASRDPSEPISNYGHEVPAMSGEDEELSVERLVNEGVEEAQHDQMIASRRQRHDKRP